MKKHILLKQIILALLFAGISSSMETSGTFGTDQAKISKRINLIAGYNFLTVSLEHDKKCKEIPSEDFLSLRNNSQTIKKDMPLSESIRTYFQKNLPFKSTDEEIREAFVSFKDLDFYLHIIKLKPIESKETNTDDCKCLIF